MGVSFSDAVDDEPERFVGYAFEENPNIKNLEDFEEAFKEAFNTPNGENTKLHAEDILALWNSKACKDKISENVSDKEMDNLYGDGILVKREVVGKKIITISEPKISVKSYSREGVSIKSYAKGYKKWTNLEKRFLQVRKAKKLSIKQTIQDYERHFAKSPRSSSSLKTKYYRL